MSFSSSLEVKQLGAYVRIVQCLQSGDTAITLTSGEAKKVHDELGAILKLTPEDDTVQISLPRDDMQELRDLFGIGIGESMGVSDGVRKKWSRIFDAFKEVLGDD